MLPAALSPTVLATRMFRPRVFYGVGLLLAVVLALIVYAESQFAAERRLALHGDGPGLVAIGAFDPARHVATAGEVLIAAQVDVSLPLQIFHRTGGRMRRALAFPVLAVDARRGEQGVAPPVQGFFHIDLPINPHEVVDPARWLPGFEKVGDFGPIVALNGQMGAPGAVSRGVVAALEGQARAQADTLLAVALFPEGRAAALSGIPASPWRHLVAALTVLSLATGFVLSRVLPLIAERRRLSRILGGGRSRRGPAPRPETTKGRRRLTPLAGPPRLALPPLAARMNGILRGLWFRSWP